MKSLSFIDKEFIKEFTQLQNDVSVLKHKVFGESEFKQSDNEELICPQQMKLKEIAKSPSQSKDERLEKLQKRMHEVEKEIEGFKMLREEKMPQEKVQQIKQEVKYKDDFDHEMRKFEHEMDIWIKSFPEKVKNLKWKANIHYLGMTGKYEGGGNGSSPDGYGTFIDSQCKMEAQWKDGKFHGKVYGEYFDGDRYYKEFKNGQQHGKWMFFWKDGRRWEHETFEGAHHGKYRKYRANGDLCEEGLYKNNQIIQQKMYD